MTDKLETQITSYLKRIIRIRSKTNKTTAGFTEDEVDSALDNIQYGKSYKSDIK